MRQVGQALGRSGEAEDLIEEVESSIAESREAHPEFEGRTISLFRFLPGDGLYVIGTNEDFSIDFLRQLGFAGITEAVDELGAGERRVLVSPERYADIEADLVIGTGSVGTEGLDELAADPVFAGLPAKTVGPTSRCPSVGRPPSCSRRC